MSNPEQQQRILNAYTFAKVKEAFAKFQQEEREKISHTEALRALHYVIRELNGLPIQF